mgnify:CR=1 FL=1
MMTGIVCITILLTTLLVLYKPFSKKPDKVVTKKDLSFEERQKEEKYKELRLYKERLANFAEKRAIKCEKSYVDGQAEPYKVVEFNNERCDEYIEMLKTYISELKQEV